LGHIGSHWDITSVWQRHQGKVAVVVRGLVNVCRMLADFPGEESDGSFSGCPTSPSDQTGTLPRTL